MSPQCSSSRVTSVSSTSVSVTWIAIPSRWCSTETTFPRSAATSSSSLISSPGRSGDPRADDEVPPADA